MQDGKDKLLSRAVISIINKEEAGGGWELSYWLINK